MSKKHNGSALEGFEEYSQEEKKRGYSKKFEDQVFKPQSAEWWDNERNLFGLAAVIADILEIPFDEAPDFKYIEKEELKKLGVKDGAIPFDIASKAIERLENEKEAQEDELSKINKEISKRMQEGVERAQKKTRKEYSPSRKKDRSKHRRK